ncbi:MAG: FG-GAP repeat protein [Solirubrobacterales bacterium]
MLGARGDFDDDGHRDLAVGSPGEDVATGGDDSDGAISVLYGTPLLSSFRGSQFITQDSPGVKGEAEAIDQFGGELAQGDFDRDGHADLAVAAPREDVPEGANDQDGSVHLLYGATGALSADGDRVLTQATDGLKGGGAPEQADHFGSTLASGDFDGDRYADLAIGVPDEGIAAGSRAGGVHVLYGSPQGLSTARDQFWTQDTEGLAGDGSEAQDLFGQRLVVGDFNDDRRDDLVVAATLEDVAAGAGDDDGAVHVIDGGPDGLTTRGDQFLSQATSGVPGDGAQAGDIFGAALATGDLDGDDREDLVVGVPFEDLALIGDNDREGTFNVLYGDSRGIGLTRNQWFTQETAGVPGDEIAEAGDRFGFTLETGDFNGDDVADLAVTALFEHVGGTGNGEHGAAHVLLGGVGMSPGASGGIYVNQAITGIEGEIETGDHFGERLAAGDFSGDGRAELVVGVPHEDIGVSGDDDGALQILRGSATGIVAANDALFTQGAPLTSDGVEAGDLFGDALP